MKSFVLTLAFVSLALSDRLDNRYLPPPNNALIANGDYNPYPASAPIVEDLRTTKSNNPIIGQASESKSQYAVPAAQNFESKVPSRQYLFPANQYSGSTSGQQQEPSGQSTVSSNQYSKPNGQFTTTFQHSGPASQSIGSSSQYSKPNGQFANTFKHSGSSGQSIVPSSQYSKPNEQFSSTFQQPGSINQLIVPSNQYAAPNGQFSSNFQPAKPTEPSTSSFNQNYKPNVHVPAVSQTFEPSGQSTILDNQYSKPIAQFSGSYQRTVPFGAGQTQSNQFSKPNGQVLSSSGQLGGYSAAQYSGTGGQTVPSGYYKNGNSAAPIGTVKSSNVPNSGDGYYSYNYETENGITAQEEGSLVNDVENARGGYSYTSPEGERVVVEYTADGEGFKPTGSHIPQIPEAILKSIELNKAALARGEYQGQYHEENEQGYAKSGPGGNYGPNSKFEGYNSKYASPILDASEVSFSSVQSDRFVPTGKNGFAQVGGLSSLQQQKAGATIGTAPHLSFAASEPSKIQFGGPQQAYGVPSFQSGTVQDTKGGYKY